MSLEQTVDNHDERIRRLEDIAVAQQQALRGIQETLLETNRLLQQVVVSQGRQLTLLEQLVAQRNGQGQ